MMKEAARRGSDEQPKKEKRSFVKRAVPQQDGVLVLYKPKGPTSAACIAKIKHGLSQKKIGHAGTLDPMAEGVLLVLLGQATKLSGYLMDNGDKIYSGSIRLGTITDTWDAEGTVCEERSVYEVTQDGIKETFASLVGTYEQEVPAYSAAKHHGKPLYELARKGLEVPVKKKNITIFCGEIESVDLPHVRFRIRCSSGTYIRSLAHSLGMRLGCGGMLEELVREYSHPFGIDRAHTVETVLASEEAFLGCITTIQDALPTWPKLILSEEETAWVKNGRALAYDVKRMANAPFTEGLRSLLLDHENKPVALAETVVADGMEKWAVLRGLWN